jgi:hypothetical protein
MKEVRLLTLLLAVLLVGAYASWTREEGGSKTADAEEKIAIYSAAPDDIKSVTLITRTQTVSVARREGADGGKSYSWFTLGAGPMARGFAGNDQTKSLWESFAPFQALRSLGSQLPDKELTELKLDKNPFKLVVKMAHGERSFEVGGRTYGSRDWYLRPAGSKEVFVVPSKVLADLESPEGRFMQRKLRDAELKDVSTVVIKAGGKEKKILHKNRLSAKDAFWADPDKADERNETLENYIHKLDNLSATKYAPDAKAEPVLEGQWFEDDKLLDTMTLLRTGGLGEKDKTSYFARSGATHVQVEVSRVSAEQIERDLSTVF